MASSDAWWPHDSFAHHTPGATCACSPRVCSDCGGTEHRNRYLDFGESWCEDCRLNCWGTRLPADTPKPVTAAFHEHLDECEQCEQHPFALCSTGARLLQAAVAP